MGKDNLNVDIVTAFGISLDICVAETFERKSLMNKKKILFISNISGERIGAFSFAEIQAAKKNNLEFHIAENFNASTIEQRKMDEEKYGITLHHIDFVRNPLHPQNFKAYKQLVQLMQKEKFDIVHCNTPVGGVYGRLAAKHCGVKKVIYQVHGFHFYKGAPKKNWLVFYPIEKFWAHITDCLITINKEDFETAQNFHLKGNGKVLYVPGVGIDTAHFAKLEFDKDTYFNDLGVSKEDKLLLSVGRLDANKNNATLIKALALLQEEKYHLLICGEGVQKNELQALAEELKVSQQVHFLGNRTDLVQLYQLVDIFVMASYREGLSRSIMEAMASGLPCVVSKIRGNVDLIQEGKGGYLVPPTSAQEFAEKIKLLLESDSLKKETSEFNRAYVQQFEVQKVVAKMTEIYKDFTK